MYGKIFDSIFDSTLVADGGFLPTYIFMSMIAIADKDGFVEIADRALYLRLGFHGGDIDFDKFKEALNYLEKSDPHSHSSLHDGKRILPLSEMDDYDGNRGWLIVNSKTYRDKGSIDDKRRADRERIAEKRRSVAKCRKVSQSVAEVAYTDTDTDTKIKDLFSYWQEIHKHTKSKLDKKRKTILKNALNDYGFDDCKKAIKGIGYSSFHMGSNETKTVYDSLSVIFKNADNVEKFTAMEKPEPTPVNKTAIQSEINARISRGADNTFEWKSNEAKAIFERMRLNGGIPWHGDNFTINKIIQDNL